MIIFSIYSRITFNIAHIRTLHHYLFIGDNLSAVFVLQNNHNSIKQSKYKCVDRRLSNRDQLKIGSVCSMTGSAYYPHYLIFI